MFLLALVVRVAWVLWRAPALTWEDERQFVEIARHLVAGDGYVSDSYRANPILPLYLAAVFRVSGEHYVVARVGQAVLGAVTCVLAGRLAGALLGPAVGLLAGLWLAVYPPHVYLASVFYVDCVLTLLLVASLCLAVRVARDAGLGAALATGVLVGLTTLTRALYVVCVPAIAVAWLAGIAAPRRRRLALVGAMTAAVALTIAPWTARNYAVYGRLLVVSSGFATKLWQGNTVLADGGPADRDLVWGTPDWEARLARLDPAARRAVEARYAAVDAAVAARTRALGDEWLALDDVLGRQIADEMRADPVRVLALVPRKFVTLYSPFSATTSTNDDTSARNRRVAALAFYPVLVLAPIGALLGLSALPRLLVPYLVVAAATCAYGALNACTRFRLPLDPLLIVFASLALVRAWERVPRRRELKEEVYGRGRAEPASG